MRMTTSFPTALRSREPRKEGSLLANRQRGVSLIEVLVTLLVLSIGLVGIALLHLNSLKFAHSSYYTSVASSAAVDLEERLWVALGSGVGGCLDSGDVSGVIEALENLWSDADASRVGVPGMTVTPEPSPTRRQPTGKCRSRWPGPTRALQTEIRSPSPRVWSVSNLPHPHPLMKRDKRV
jgi:prepilin-type N-terminal cleavage/methylation domain-containing protein